MSSSVIVARPAATVVVLRDAPTGFEVLLLRRHDNVAFMAGAFVFPGGRVDDADRVQTPEESTAYGGRFHDLTIEEELVYRRAAVRELREEANVRVLAADLVALAHWVTPQIEIRRYDTRFFLARLPEGQLARHDDHETTASIWVSPDEAIDQCRAGQILLPPPTWTTFRQLQVFDAIEDVFEWARRRTIVRVEPGFIRNEEVTMLTLPGDPLFATIPGWEVPEETRFVLRADKRWVAERAPEKS